MTGELRLAPLAPQTGCLALLRSPDGRRLYTGCVDGTVRIRDIASGACLALFVGHCAGVSALALSPDGRWLYSGSWDGTIRLWDMIPSSRKNDTFVRLDGIGPRPPGA